MSNYSFKTLNDKEFEILVGDLLSKELGVEFQSFKSGRDKGIDLRYSTSVDNKIIVQVKHYVQSDYSQLKHQLKKKELPKIKLLNPERYIVATSLELNPSETEEIKKILEPYVLSINDIYWNQRINKLLSIYKDIERKHFKLWFSSTAVLSNILNNSSYLKSYYLEKELQKKISYYVKTDFHDNATKILKEQKVLLITGAPGVGKTTLAEMIILDFINNGYEHLVVEDKISEAENILSYDDDKKQIVYFDDFLGSNIYEILNPRNSESVLTKFISRIKTSPNKFLILTTRTTILNQALHNYEKLKYQKLHNISNYEIYMSDYSLYNKAEILYNHLFFGEIDDNYRNQIFKDKNYLKIIKHKNYNPRLIEYFTSMVHIQMIKPENYLKFISENLINPEEIWRNSFENQTIDEDKFLLITLFTLRGEASFKILEEAFNARINSEIQNYGHTLKHNSFNISIKNLEGSYLNTFYDGVKKENRISFVNPSISDFLINYLRHSNSEKLRLFEGAKYLEQITNIFHPKYDNYLNFSSEQGKRYSEIFIKNEEKLNSLSNEKIFLLEFLKTLIKLFNDVVNPETIINLFRRISFDDINNFNVNDYIFLMENTSSIKEIRDLIIENWKDIILNLYYFARDEYAYSRIVFLFEDFEQSYEEFISEEDNNELISQAILDLMSGIVEQNVLDNTFEYDFREKEEYHQYDHLGNYYSETIGFELEDDINDLIYKEFSKFQEMDFLINGPFLDSSELSINRDDLIKRIEETYLDHRINTYESEFPKGGNISTRGVSEEDRINNLFSE